MYEDRTDSGMPLLTGPQRTKITPNKIRWVLTVNYGAWRLLSGSELPLVFAMNSWKFAQSLMRFVNAGELGLLDAMS